MNTTAFFNFGCNLGEIEISSGEIFTHFMKFYFIR